MPAASSLAVLRSKIESDLRGRIVSPFNYRDRNNFQVVSTGIAELDTRVGGLPRGAMTEICGPACSGRTSVLQSALAVRTTEGESCALVDARDSFDPATANAAGVDLSRLLWVRCHDIDQALRATDLLIQGGGFGIVAVDLSDISARLARQVPLHVWFRFRRAVEDTSTILLLLEQETNAKTCASLVLRLEAEPAQWSEMESTRWPHTTVRDTTAITRYDEPFAPERSVEETKCPHARLLQGFEVCTEVVRSRIVTEVHSDFANQLEVTEADRVDRVVEKTGIVTLKRTASSRALWSAVACRRLQS
jgi:recombination protein RecA